MPIDAKLILYSGRKNVPWTLSGAQVQALTARLKGLSPMTGSPEQWQPSGGYRGVEVAISPDLHLGVRKLLLYDKVVSADGTFMIDSNRSVETFLLSLSPELQALGVTPQEIQAPAATDLISGIVGSADGDPCHSAPPFPSTPGVWTSPGNNNCYSYANNERNLDPLLDCADPGGHTLSMNGTDAAVAKRFVKAAEKDKLESLGKKLPAVCPIEPDAHYFAICLRHFAGGKVRDYHCIRLDRTGGWSHKDGPGPVANLDNANQPMGSLNLTRLVWKPKLVGFFKSVKGKREIKFS